MTPNEKLKPLLDNAPYVAEAERNNNKTIIFSVVITAIVFSALTFFWQNFNQKNKNEEISQLSSKVTTLSSQLAVLQAGLTTKTDEEVVTNDVANVMGETKTYTNTQLGFSFEYPKDLLLNSGGENNLYLTVGATKLSNWPIDYYKSDKEALDSGKLGHISWAVDGSMKLLKIDDFYAEQGVVLAAVEACDVQFSHTLIFYKDNQQITISLHGPEGDITSAMAKYFTVDKQNCADEKIWKEGAPEDFYNDLVNKTAPKVAQNWYDLFDQIVSTIKIN